MNRETIAIALATAYWHGRLQPESRIDGLMRGAIDAAAEAAAKVFKRRRYEEAGRLLGLPAGIQKPDAKAVRVAALNIFTRLEIDIKSRNGIDDEWQQIDRHIVEKEIRPEWEKIFREEINALLNNEQ